MRHLFHSLIALTVGAALVGCPSAPVDKDANPASATLPQITTKLDATGTIDAKKNKVDWKIMTAPMAGDAKLVVSFPEDHKVEGQVGVYSPLAAGEKVPEALAEKSVSPDNDIYTLKWEVEAGKSYLFKIAATGGAGAYTVSSLDITEPPPPDPCLGVECPDGEECNDKGECVAEAPQVCKPACRGGKVCMDGECVAPCGGSCPRGQICNRKENECVRDPCFGKNCPSGERCYGGVCKAVPKPKPCGGKCGADEKCVSDKCVKEDTSPPPSGGPITGSIVQILPAGAKSTIFINRGSVKGVKVGMSGTIKGVPGGTFKIVEVYEFRCKATVDVDEKTIGTNKSVVIN